MLRQSDGKTGTREWTALIIILITIFATDMTPTVLFPQGKTATWMFPIVWLIVISIPLIALLSLLKLYKNKGLIEIIYHVTGRYFGFLINSILFIILLFATILNTRSYVDIIRGVFLRTTPAIAIYFVFMGASFLIAKRGFEVIGRLSWLIIFYFEIGIILLIVLLFNDLDFSNLFPLRGPGIISIAKQGVTQVSIIAEIILISIFFPYARDYKDYKVSNLLGLGIGLLQFVIMLIMYLTLFGYSVLEAIPYPFQQVTKLAGIERFFTNLDAVYLFFWLSIAILRLAFYLYLLSAAFAYTVKLTEFEPLLLSFSGLVILLGVLPKNPVQTTFQLRNSFLLKQSWLFFLLLPLTLWVVAHLRGEFKK